MSSFTFGGLPAEEASRWCKDTYQQLGKIIWSLQSGNETDRVWGRRHYHYLKREFMRDEWDAYIARINTECRLPRGMKTIEELVGDAEGPPWSMPREYEPAPAEGEVAGLQPAAEAVPAREATDGVWCGETHQMKKITVEQLSLF